MDRHETVKAMPQSPGAGSRVARRQVLRWGLAGAGCAAAGVLLGYRWLSGAKAVVQGAAQSTDVFHNDAPKGELWQNWLRQGWAVEARHYLQLGRNVQCKLCPNECLLRPDDRGRCRDRVNKDGKLYTLVYGAPCAVNIDPIEKKPLLHFLPGTDVFSFAASGCGFRCLNCQNWEISQRKPEETKDADGPQLRLRPENLEEFSATTVAHVSMFPEDVVALAEFFDSPSIAYTYSEPTVWFEYMIDTARLARNKNIRNVWVTCGYIQEKPLRELCQVLDAANVDLKSFDPEVYGKLNCGKLEPILRTLKILKEHGIWFEVTNLVVPTYTDDLNVIRRMCGWLVDNLGPDYPLHFSRFHPAFKLEHLPPTPKEILLQAREIARQYGLRYVYIGNVLDIDDAATTFCPGCNKVVIRRVVYEIVENRLEDGKCPNCGQSIAGVWS